jgi:hypothetical protein
MHGTTVKINKNIYGTKPTKYTQLFLMYSYYKITPHIPKCLDPQETIAGESNQSNTE